MDNKDYILACVLDCGIADISIIEDCKYDWNEIVEDTKTNYGNVNLGNIFFTIMNFGQGDLANKISERIEELEGQEERGVEESEELESLKKLDVYEDIETFFNYLDTHVYIIKNEEIYRKYLEEALDDFEENTGFVF